MRLIGNLIWAVCYFWSDYIVLHNTQTIVEYCEMSTFDECCTIRFYRFVLHVVLVWMKNVHQIAWNAIEVYPTSQTYQNHKLSTHIAWGSSANRSFFGSVDGQSETRSLFFICLFDASSGKIVPWQWKSQFSTLSLSLSSVQFGVYISKYRNGVLKIILFIIVRSSA